MIGRRDITCREVVEIVSQYLDGTLSRRDTKRVERHLRGCDACTEYVSQMRKMIRAVHAIRIREEEIPSAVRAELLQAFRGWKQGR